MITRLTAFARTLRVPAPAELERMSDDQAIGLFRVTRRERARTALLAEMERRDRADRRTAALERARQALEAQRDAYALYVYDAWMAAETACNGYLLSKAGKLANKGRGVEPADLWSMPEKTAVRYASPELIEWWGLHGRWTFRQFQKQSREQRPEAAVAA